MTACGGTVTAPADGYGEVALSLRQGTSNRLRRAASPFVCPSPIQYIVQMRNMLVCLMKTCVLFNSQIIVL